MKSLTIRQPWAGAFFAEHNAKDIENRAQAFTYRGPVLIHAGAQLAAPAGVVAEVAHRTGVAPQVGVPRAGAQWALGSVIGVADLVQVHSVDECRCSCSVWAQPARAHLRFTNARLLKRPVPAAGKLGLWTPDAELLREVERIGFVR